MAWRRWRTRRRSPRVACGCTGWARGSPRRRWGSPCAPIRPLRGRPARVREEEWGREIVRRRGRSGRGGLGLGDGIAWTARFGTLGRERMRRGAVTHHDGLEVWVSLAWTLGGAVENESMPPLRFWKRCLGPRRLRIFLHSTGRAERRRAARARRRAGFTRPCVPRVLAAEVATAPPTCSTMWPISPAVP